jgi:hypothetical protein
LALGGRPAAIFARRLMLPVSNDTLLRMVRRRAGLRTEPLSAIGIDDWALRPSLWVYRMRSTTPADRHTPCRPRSRDRRGLA